MLRYWENAEATARAIDAEGWLHTGDLGRLTGGQLQVIGRMGDEIVTSNGEKYSPADVELRIAADPLFEQVAVFGNGRPFPVALVVLNERRWRSVARALGLGPQGLEDKGAEKALLERIAVLTADLPRFAQVRRLLASVVWTVENGLATTQKPKRKALANHGAAIGQLYSQISSPAYMCGVTATKAGPAFTVNLDAA
jgi:long-chain acyl-CoA synthetase